MSQQFLSKYFKPAGESSKAKAGKGTNDIPPVNRASRQAEAAASTTQNHFLSRHGGGKIRAKQAKRKLSSSRDEATRTEEKLSWICPQCTFHNTEVCACKICGQPRQEGVSNKASKASVAPQMEIEILSSDEGASANTANNEDGDSEFEEEESIGHRRKRTKRTKASSPGGGGARGRGILSGTSKILQDATSDESPRLHPSMEPDSSPTSHAAMFEGTELKLASRDANQSKDSSSDQSISASPGCGAPQESTRAPADVIMTDSFKLEEDLQRRKKFQAAMKVLSQDQEEISRRGDDVVDHPRDPSDSVEGTGQNAGDESGVSHAKVKFPCAATRGRAKGKAGSSGVKLTPMEQQVVDLKAQHPGVLLLVECGYRYRFFGEDALVAAKVLRIYAHMDHSFHVASVPTYRLPVHVRRLVEAGCKVGVVRQAESAALKAAGLTGTAKSSMFKRELAGVFSQATWVEGAVEALMPASASSSGGVSAGGGARNEEARSKGSGQGSWRKFGGAWRRVGGWGGGRQGDGEAKVKTVEPTEPTEPTGAEDPDVPLPELDDERSEQWLLSLYEEDASSDAKLGEPVSIVFALRDDGGQGSRKCSRGGPGDSTGEDPGVDGPEVDKVRIGVVAVDVRTGRVVHDTFVEASGQRRELDTRMRHLRPLELLAPGPRLSKATESTMSRYCRSAVDGKGSKRVIRTERAPPEEFCFDAAQASLNEYYGKIKGEERPSEQGRSIAGTAPVRSAGADAPALTRVLDLPQPVVCALGPLVGHLKRFGLDRALASPELMSFSQSQYMTLDAVTLRDLEVLECQADGREAGSLLSVLNHTQTAFGRRVLVGWVRQPLLSAEDILARQEAVEELATNPPVVIERLRPVLRELKDLDPAIASLHYRRIQPARLLSLLSTMRKGSLDDDSDSGVRGSRGGAEIVVFHDEAQSAVLRDTINGVPVDMASLTGRFLDELDANAAAADDYAGALVHGESLCVDVAAAVRAEELAIAGLHKELQSVRSKVRKPSLQWKTLRTGLTSSVEYLVELRKSEAKKLVPESWIQVSQTKDLVRFHTPRVLELQQDLLTARESRNIACRQAWAELVSQVDSACYQGFRYTVQALGTLDALLSLAAVAKLPGYVKPVYRPLKGARVGDGARGGSEGSAAGESMPDAIVLRGARHPTVERVLEGGFVPNDIDLRRGECMVITGPNMGGKSSTVRMVALICLLGQIGSYVPADSAEMFCLDGIYTRMGAGDDLAADMSTFMVELWHTSYILKHSTSRSLVILDELGRGTSTHDGVAIALATLRHIIRDIGCATLFVTHYPQVSDLAEDKSLSGNVKNAHMSFIENSPFPEEPGAKRDVEEDSDQTGSSSHDEGGGDVGGAAPATGASTVTFLYRLVAGQAHRSYGLNVARAAGMDEDMIALATLKSAEMRER